MTTLKHLRAFVGLGLLVGACGSPNDDRPADWEYIAPAIIIPNCATSSCHSEAAAAAGLDMSTSFRAYRSMLRLQTNVLTCGGDKADDAKDECKPGEEPIKRPLVTPNNPEQSRVVNMMRARGAERMPPDRPLAEADIELFEQWIREGAKR